MGEWSGYARNERKAFNIISNYRQNGEGLPVTKLVGVEGNVLAVALAYNFDYVICWGKVREYSQYNHCTRLNRQVFE